ncbi:MAG: VWA domain-containing protein [Planctomycetes bacterium]|nr:VWA domain-containing protein [Planctomycetota bacterium]
MDWPDWNTLSLGSPQNLPVLLVCAILLACAALLIGRRHDRRTRLIAGALRLGALGMLGLVLLGPVVTVNCEARFEPAGRWTLLMDGAETFYVTNGGRGGPGRVPSGPDVFSEAPDEFVDRVRNALAAGHPPESALVVADFRAKAAPVRDALQALGVPCRIEGWREGSPDSVPVLRGIEAPLEVKPGEPFKVKFTVAGPAARVDATLDGEPLELIENSVEIRSELPGRHVLAATLLDADGNELQRVGHVFRVGEPPVVLALGLDDVGYRRAAELAPDMQFTRISVREFRNRHLERDGKPVEMVLTSVDALNALDAATGVNAHQADSLAGFVARGGGLFVTGDGAKYVAPEHMSVYARQMLPVILQKEGKQPPPDNPPVVEEPIKVEVAKVSICFVIDRSLSMTTPIGTNGPTRWSVASKGVAESLNLVDNGGRREAADKTSEAIATRVGVVAFTLKQEWVYGMAPAYKFQRDQIARDLTRIGDELSQVKMSDFDAQGYNTDIYAAMDSVLDVMKDEKSAVKMIVMLTDGGDRPENTLAGLKHSDLRQKAIANDINVITIGIGTGFDSSSVEGDAARKVVTELATKRSYAYIAADTETAKKANVIFVDSVDLAFEAYDDKKKLEEEKRRRKLEEEIKRGEEPPKVDVMPGTFPLQLAPVGAQLFGADALPKPAPKVAWVARSYAREGAAVALAAETSEADSTPVLAFKGYGLGRVAFWGAGTDPQSLGELTGWGDFPGIFAGSLRWLLPREVPDVRLLGAATPDGIHILDPIPDASYLLRTANGDVPLELKDDRLLGKLPLGPGEVIERVSNSEDSEERGIGDVYVAETPPIESHQFAEDTASQIPPLVERPPEVTSQSREATLPVLYLLTLVMLLMPIERLVRRRS